jgi:hypothetical protein
MRECFQFKTMSMLDHGLDVRAWYLDLLQLRRNRFPQKQWMFPDWIEDALLLQQREKLDPTLVELYQIYHDCGKPLCRTVDGEGKQHFPDHSLVSRDRWLECSDGSPAALLVADLIAQDMDIHLLRSVGVDEFKSRPHAVTLLLTGLCELHSNASMFGGVGSTGFKIKYKNIDRFGARIVGGAR